MDREKILQFIRENKAKASPLPKPFSAPEEESGNLLTCFKEMLQQVGGGCFEVNGEKKLNALLDEHFPDATDFRKKDPWEQYLPNSTKEKLNKLKTVILEGQFGVAENAAVWMDDSNFPDRLVPIIAEKIVICLNSLKIVSDMHEAYSIIDKNLMGFGVFLSGPSKTADIEQNLVFGAHGAKKQIIIFY